MWKLFTPQTGSCLTLCVAFVLSLAAEQRAVAQPGGNDGDQTQDSGRDRGSRRDRGGRGGFGGRGPGGFGGPGRPGGFGITGELNNASTKEEISFTPEQQAKLDELMEARRDQMRNMPVSPPSEDETDEDRDARREEMRKFFEQQQAETESQIKSILNENQWNRLQQITLHRSGPSALTRDDLAAEFKLTDEQKSQLNDLGAEYFSARREQGFNASPEDREKLRAEFNSKYLAVLTPDQQKAWQSKVGAPPKDMGGAGIGPAGSPTAAQPPVKRSSPGYEPVPDAPPILSLASTAPKVAAATIASGAAASAPQPQSGKADGVKKMSFSFRFAPWLDVLTLFAKEAGLSLDIRDMPPGTFNYFDQAEYTPVEALDIINGFLIQRGYILIRRDQSLVCINFETGQIPPNLVPTVSAAELPQRGRNELMTVVFPLEGVDVTKVANEVDLIKGPQGSVHGMTTTNSLIVTDIGTNLRRIQDMLGTVTTPSSPDTPTFKHYDLKFIDSDDAEIIVRAQLGVTQTATNVSSSNNPGRGGRGDFRGDFRGGPPQQPQTPQRVVATPVQITSEPRTNQLLVVATVAQHQIVEELLKVVDVEAAGGIGGGGSRKPFLRVYSVNTSDPRDVTRTLDAIVPGVVVNEDTRARKVHIVATEAQHQVVASLIAQLDGTGSGNQQVVVIPLMSMDPMTAASSLRQMFIRDGNEAPTIEPEVYGRQVMVRGTPDQIAQVKTLLASLGEDGTGQRSTSRSGKLRTFSLSGRSPQEILPLIERLWENSSSSPIRIVNPRDRGPIRGVRQPGSNTRETPTSTTEPRAPREPRPAAKSYLTPLDRASNNALPPNSLHTRLTSTTVEESSPTAPDAPLDEEEYAFADEVAQEAADDAGEELLEAISEAATEEAGAPVTITILGDELILSSSDEKALDKLEDLLQSTIDAIPPRNAWTIFTLQSADATETAELLKQLFPDSTVAASSQSSTGMMGAFTSGFSNFGSSMMDMTGMSTSMLSGRLTIIPDVRLNALFVAGPPGKVQDVEQMLGVLDSTDWPQSLRDRMPRMIAVEHADVDEVFTIVKDVYKDFLESDQQQQARAGANALSAMMGGGGRGNQQQQQQRPPAQLTLGVDRRTSNLVVSANDELYREIQLLVGSLDKSAQDAQRTVRIVQVENADPNVLIPALGSVVPKVRVSSAATRPTRREDQGSQQGQGQGQQDQDAMRRMFEQRMRERTQGGGGNTGGSPFGGGNLQQRGGRGGFNGMNPFGGGGGGSPFGGRQNGGRGGGGGGGGRGR